MSKSDLSRRAFLAATTTTAAAVVSTRVNAAEVVPGKKSPNEKVPLAAIGGGGKGSADIWGCHKGGAEIVAIADPDWDRAGDMMSRFPDAKKFKDYRVMLDEFGENFDACTVTTPDHSHAPAAYQAMNLGKHVYVQKPLTHTIAEARLLAKTAKETGVVTQMGNQGHCGDGVRDLCEMVWDGAIGQVKEAHIWTSRPVWPQGILEPLPKEEIPKNMDWDLWIGPAQPRDYNKMYAPFNWRGWWDFGCGAIGDMACHIMDPTFWALKLYEAEGFSVEPLMVDCMNEQTAPLASTIKFEFPARGDMDPVTVYWYDGKVWDPATGSRSKQNFPKWPEHLPQVNEEKYYGDGANGSFFVGTDGVATAGEYGGESRLLPAENMTDYTRPEKTLRRIKREDPYLEFITAIKEGRKAVSDFSYASLLTETANFGNVALFAGSKLEWDSKAFKITNNEDANKYLTKEYRKGWELPC